MKDRGTAGKMGLTRRSALIGGTAMGGLLFASLARAQGSATVIKRYAAPRQVRDIDHQVVYRREDEFAGWPHTSGFWNFGDGELLQNVMSLYTDYPDPDSISHDNIGRGGRGGKMVTLRSKDFGRTWDGDDPTADNYGNVDKSMANARTMGDLRPIDFLDKNVIFSNSGSGFGTPDGRTEVRVSRDRGHTWSPAIPVPLDGLHSISGMNSHFVRPDGTAMIWLMEVDEDGWNRRPCIFALPPNGTDFHFMTFITPKHDPYGQAAGDYQTTYRFGGHRWFYPRGYLLPSGRMLCVMRCQRDPRGDMWTEVHHSDDGGRTWAFLSRVNDFGAPGSLVQLPDSRLVVVYGYRLMPSGIRARVSEDEGRTWGPELIIRDDGGSWDLGYPNAWVTDDGKVGVLYYFNSNHDRINVNGGVRHIQRSIFSVDDLA